MSFGSDLRTLRLRLGLSQVQAAERLDMARITIAKYEAGEREPLPAPSRTAAQLLSQLEHGSDETRLARMSREERSLLLYFECCAVDQAGRIDVRRINNADFEIAQRWSAEGFVGFGRILSSDISGPMTHWCHLSEDAWRLVHLERRLRAERMWEQRSWFTTAEAREEVAS